MSLIKKPFDTYRMTYGIVSHDTTEFKDYARIDCYNGAEKAGQVLFGSSIKPGNSASLSTTDEIHLYFPLSHVSNILKILKLGAKQPGSWWARQRRRPLALYLEIDEHTSDPRMGGIIVDP